MDHYFCLDWYYLLVSISYFLLWGSKKLLIEYFTFGMFDTRFEPILTKNISQVSVIEL